MCVVLTCMCVGVGGGVCVILMCMCVEVGGRVCHVDVYVCRGWGMGVSC